MGKCCWMLPHQRKHAQFFKVQLLRYKGLATPVPAETPAELLL